MRPKQQTSLLAYSTYYSKNNNILHHIWHTTSKSRKVAEENEKRSFGRATLLKKRNTENWKIKGRKRRARYGFGTSDKKKNTVFDNFFLFWRPEIVIFSQPFLCVLSFTQLTNLLVGKIDYLTNMSNFYVSVQFLSNFGHFFAISRIRNCNPLNWTVLCVLVRFFNILYWYSMFLICIKIDQKFSKLDKLA